MPWPRASQRVLIVLAAALLALGVIRGGQSGRQPAAVSSTDDPRLEMRLDLNRASTADLESLPGVGTALAGRIVAYRTAHGPFRSVQELRRVPGIGAKLVAALVPLVDVK